MSSETLDLARLQFAITAGAHFLFVALTLGLVTIVACLQTRATLTHSPIHWRMTRFWGQLYVINYAVGIVTGIVMEFQFGMNWSGLGHFAGNVFGAGLAMETLVAFFLESTFLGLWIFGWHRLNRWVHLALIWGITLTAYASAYWILVTNGFLQNPVGYRVEDGSLVLADLNALLTNHSAILPFFHILCGALVTGAFVMAGVSAFHLLRRTTEQEFFVRSLRIGVAVGLPALIFTASFGGMQFAPMGESQPAKLASYVGDQQELDRLEGELIGQFGPGEHLPPQEWVQTSATLMLASFGLMLMLSFGSALLMWFRPVVLRFRLWHVLLIAAIPMPFVAMLAGWVFREVGRQPWVVYGLLRVEEAVSPISSGAMRGSLIVFSVLFGLLVLVNYWLLARQAARGPDAVTLGSVPAETRRNPLPPATF
ncbi:cytochrome ubiquinol oxidase subunit I [Actinoalloteichus hymeniacidonis]|uniref:cytochrome ubiquinol oxidase subunit I n=1 Tax=Actinoalloteichus hymeniacidonis TaxID=340345 RepID=UPI0012F8B2C9|nr:cytochrome ubiquinol oxidase subunit I [Actinoalloteichus hymeniacidonis]MBB5907093.1 cytochrome d ubiquinol oxidase subunit I [Actinoalloteichus hymeniacidonis]